MARTTDPIPFLLWRKVLQAFAPALLVLTLTAVALVWSEHFGEQLMMMLDWAPFVLIGVGLAAALHFNRSRAFFSLLSLLVASYGLTRYPESNEMFHAVSVLLPLNLTLFALIRERGVFSRAGTMRFLFIFLQCVFVAILVSSESTKLLWLLTMPLFSSALTKAVDIGPPAILLILLALLLLHGRMVLDPSPERAGFFGATIAVVLALYNGFEAAWTTAFLAAAGLIFLLALVQTSWRMAFLDELTGLPGRRALEDQLARLHEPYAIAMVDVDHFKGFNDTWGHDAGDEVLRMVAAHLTEVGGGGKAYRYGGEEFTVVFPDKRVRDTLAALGALRKDIEEDTFILRRRDRQTDKPQSLNITVSIGVADAERFDTPQEVMGAADKALYRAKDSGRNQVCR